MLQNLSSAAVVIGILRVNELINWMMASSSGTQCFQKELSGRVFRSSDRMVASLRLTEGTVLCP